MTLGSNAVMIKESFYNNYLFYFLSNAVGQHLIDGIISGSAQPKFNKTALRSLELVIPSNEIIEDFNTIVDSIRFKLNLNFANNRTLSQIRNRLLPKLMTGKIRVA
jgi:type I restriction enzyme S subunit